MTMRLGKKHNKQCTAV